MKTSTQLRLFSEQLVAWETLPRDCQHSLHELLSRLLEQAISRQRHESETNQLREEDHV